MHLPKIVEQLEQRNLRIQHLKVVLLVFQIGLSFLPEQPARPRESGSLYCAKAVLDRCIVQIADNVAHLADARSWP